MWTRGLFCVSQCIFGSISSLYFPQRTTSQLQKMSALKWPCWQQHKTPQQSRNPWFQKTHKRITFLRVILVMQTWCFQEIPGNEMSLLLWYAGISYSPCCRMWVFWGGGFHGGKCNRSTTFKSAETRFFRPSVESRLKTSIECANLGLNRWRNHSLQPVKVWNFHLTFFDV